MNAYKTTPFRHSMADQFNADQVTPFKLNTNISKELTDVLERSLTFSEIVRTNDNKNLSVHKLETIAQNLEFSESTVGGLQFSNVDVATPAIGNWTFGGLNMLIQEVGSSVNKDTILSMAFPDKAVPALQVQIDRIVGNTGIAPEFGGDNSQLPTIRPLDTYGLTYEPGLWGGRTMLTSKDIAFARKRGVGSFDQRGIGQLSVYNTVNIVTQIMTRKKYLLNQAIFDNAFQYGGNWISSNIPSSNYIAMYESMGTLNANGSVTYSNIDPNYTPFIAITNILNNPIFIKYRNYIKGIVCNGADLQAIMNHPNVKPVTNLLAAANSSLGRKKYSVVMGEFTKELNAYYANGFDFPLLPDDDVWVSQNASGTTKTTPNDATNSASAQQFFVPRGKMYVMLDLTSMGGQNGAFHLTYNEVDPNTDAPAMGLYTGIFNRNLHNADTVNRLDIVGALSGAPAIYMPEAQFILTSLYANV